MDLTKNHKAEVIDRLNDLQSNVKSLSTDIKSIREDIQYIKVMMKAEKKKEEPEPISKGWFG